MHIREFAELSVSYGINVLPCREDKKPVSSWKRYEVDMYSEFEDFDKSPCTKVAFIAGMVSRNLEVLDIDLKYDLTGKIYGEFEALVKANLPDVKFYIVQTANGNEFYDGGYHYYYRITGRHAKSRKLAKPKGFEKVIIETRGEGGYAITYPSPGYSVVSGSVSEIPTLTEEQYEILLSISTSFDEKIEVASRVISEKSKSGSPFEDYNNRGDVIGLLESRGWKYQYEAGGRVYLSRPEKSRGVSASFNNQTRVLWVFSDNCEGFNNDTGYSPATVFKIAECGGDASLAAKKLFDLGFGDRNAKKVPDMQQLVDENGSTRKFWYFDEEDRCSVIRYAFRQWLQESGVYRFRRADDDYLIVMIKDKIIKETFRPDIKKMVYDYLKVQDRSFELYEYFSNKEKHIFSDGFFEELDVVNDRSDFYIMKDTASHAFKFFKNCVVIVDKDGIKEIPHSECYGYIWSNQIMNRDFKYTEEKGDWGQFLLNISNGDSARARSLMSVLGYLCYTFKQSDFCPAIVFQDANLIDGKPDGRTGKGLLLKACGNLVNAVIEDGKTFSFDKSFPYQKVKIDTQLYYFDDVPKFFNFERLFSLITEGMPVEKKNLQAFTIEFKDSPKIAVTTNYTIQGEGSSFDDRRIIFELHPHYSNKYKPKDDFGRRFFDEWDALEWNKFDSLMVKGIQMYLQSSILPIKDVLNKEKKLRNLLGKDLFVYCEDVVRNIPILRTDMKNMVETFIGYKIKSQQILGNYFQAYCDYRGIKLEVFKSSGDWYYEFVDKVGVEKSLDINESVQEIKQSEMMFNEIGSEEAPF